MILQGVTETRCRKCKHNYFLQDLQPPCVNGDCIITHRPKTRLNFQDYLMLQKLLDYHSTGQMIDKNIDTRELLYGLEQKVIEFAKVIRDLRKETDG